jgi:hypothetical protein
MKDQHLLPSWVNSSQEKSYRIEASSTLISFKKGGWNESLGRKQSGKFNLLVGGVKNHGFKKHELISSVGGV